MTAIGAWCWDGLPVLVGDIAVSGFDDKSFAQVPTVGSVASRFPPGSGYVVSGTRQKVVVLSDRLGVAWAGSRLAAEEAFGLIGTAKASVWSLEAIDRVLAGLEDCRTNRELILIGWVRERDVWTRFVFEDMRLSAAPEPLVRGTGAEVLRQAHRMDLGGSGTGEEDARLRNAARCAALTGYLMQGDVSSSSSLLNYFGGGYESVSIRFERLEKLEVATHILWDCRVHGSQLHVRPLRVLRNFYMRGYLFVRSADIEFLPGSETLQLRDQVLHIVGAPGLPDFLENQFQVEIPSFRSPMTGSHALLREGDNPPKLMNYVSTEFALIEDAKRGTIQAPAALFSAMSRQVRETI